MAKLQTRALRLLTDLNMLRTSGMEFCEVAIIPLGQTRSIYFASPSFVHSLEKILRAGIRTSYPIWYRGRRSVSLVPIEFSPAGFQSFPAEPRTFSTFACSIANLDVLISCIERNYESIRAPCEVLTRWFAGGVRLEAAHCGGTLSSALREILE